MEGPRMTLQKIIEDLDALAPAARLERNALDAIRAERAFTRSEYRLRGVLTKIINAADAAAEITPTRRPCGVAFLSGRHRRAA